MATVLILGGGVGGWTAAQRLRRELAGGAPTEVGGGSGMGDSHRIVLVDREPQQAFAPSFLWVMMGERQPQHVVRPLASLRRQGIDYLQAEAQQIDPAGRRVRTSAGELAYDFLIVALGAELYPQGVPGLAEAAYTFYDLPGAQGLHQALKGFTGGRVAIAVAGTPYKCPSAPHEAGFLLEDHFRRRGLRAEIAIFTPEAQPMPSAGPAIGQALGAMLSGQGIAFHPNRKLSAVEGQELLFEGGPRERFDLLITVPPHRSPACVRESGLADASGYIPADPRSLATQHEGVFALGDVTTVPLPGRYHPERPLNLPKAGVFAHSQAEVVARNIAAQINGRGQQQAFDGTGYCFLETGGGRAGLASARFYGEPAPAVAMKPPARLWHWGKALFEGYWLAEGPRRELLRRLLNLGARSTGIAGSL